MNKCSDLRRSSFVDMDRLWQVIVNHLYVILQDNSLGQLVVGIVSLVFRYGSVVMVVSEGRPHYTVI